MLHGLLIFVIKFVWCMHVLFLIHYLFCFLLFYGTKFISIHSWNKIIEDTLFEAANCVGQSLVKFRVPTSAACGRGWPGCQWQIGNVPRHHLGRRFVDYPFALDALYRCVWSRSMSSHSLASFSQLFAVVISMLFPALWGAISRRLNPLNTKLWL